MSTAAAEDLSDVEREGLQLIRETGGEVLCCGGTHYTQLGLRTV